jgi:hypothetical protein
MFRRGCGDGVKPHEVQRQAVLDVTVAVVPFNESNLLPVSWFSLILSPELMPRQIEAARNSVHLEHGNAFRRVHADRWIAKSSTG